MDIKMTSLDRHFHPVLWLICQQPLLPPIDWLSTGTLFMDGSIAANIFAFLSSALLLPKRNSNFHSRFFSRVAISTIKALAEYTKRFLLVIGCPSSSAQWIYQRPASSVKWHPSGRFVARLGIISTNCHRYGFSWLIIWCSASLAKVPGPQGVDFLGTSKLNHRPNFVNAPELLIRYW